MGFDKPDLAFVIHFQCPQSLIHHYQQVGRAGRGIERAIGALLVGNEDRRIAEYFFRNAFPPKDVVDRILRALDDASDGLKQREIEQQVNERAKVIEHALKLLSVEARPPVFKQRTRWYRTIHPAGRRRTGPTLDRREPEGEAADVNRAQRVVALLEEALLLGVP